MVESGRHVRPTKMDKLCAVDAADNEPGMLDLKEGGTTAPPLAVHPRAAICNSAALRPTDWPGFSTGRSKGFQASPTTFS